MSRPTAKFYYIIIRVGAIFSAIFLGAVLPLQAQFSDNIDITFTASQEELRVGDLVELTLQVKHPQGYEVKLPQLPSAWGEYEVRSQTEPETVSNDDGSEITSQVMVVTLFAPGVYQTPMLNLALRDAQGELIERVVSQLSLTVTPVSGETDTELRDIKLQFDMPVPLPWAWLGGGLLGAILLIIVGWWFYKRLQSRPAYQPEVVTRPVIDPRPPYQIAYEELARIERLDLPGQGRFKEYYSLVTDCLRYYLGGMHAVPAIDLTTTETKQALRQTIIPLEHVLQFIRLFSEGDLVKFARFVPDIERARAIIGQARLLVDVTKIVVGTQAGPVAERPTLETEVVTQEAA